MSILETVERFCKVDKQFGLEGKGSLINLIELNDGFDLMEELQKIPS
jgi:hypothetical protein